MLANLHYQYICHNNASYEERHRRRPATGCREVRSR
ncbi:hypothetical protein CKU38_02626 [Xanthomonas citri pv. fuscans]|nr:hypothetical protein CKU38_02626 [Xanthomonas citri pv. fuscans]